MIITGRAQQARSQSHHMGHTPHMGHSTSRANPEGTSAPTGPDGRSAPGSMPEPGRLQPGQLPSADACGHFGLRIARDGTWYYHGSPIGRKAIPTLFARVLRREDDGSFWLVTPVERGRIDVDDAPFVAVALAVRQEAGRQRLLFTTNLDEEVTAGPEHELRLAEPDPGAGEDAGGTPYLHVRRGLEARLTPAVWYQLADLAVAEGEALGVWSDGVFFALAAVYEA